MNSADALKSETPATPVYRCSADGCLSYTDGFYCTAHVVLCEDCGEEAERGSLVNGRCGSCLRAACRRPVDDGVRFLQDCCCGLHAVRS
jgi:hypothetical protein